MFLATSRLTGAGQVNHHLNGRHTMFKRTAVVAAIATAGLAPSASAMQFTNNAGSFTTPSIDVPGNATVSLGPLGEQRIGGVKQLRLSVEWGNALGIVKPAVGTRCTIDSSVRIHANRRTSVRVSYSYVRDNPAPRRDTRHRATKTIDAGDLSARPWTFGVCYR
jgi:hypothetical protein